MPSTGTHRYGGFVAPIARGTIVVNGPLTLPTSGVSTFNLGASTYYESGIYTLITFTSLVGGTVPTNFAVNAAGIASLGLGAGTPYQEENSIKVVIS